MHLNWLLHLFTIVELFLKVNSIKKPLYLLSLLPYPDPNGTQPSWTEGPSLILAEQLAVDIINKRTDLLPDHTLSLLQGDSGCNIKTKAAVSFINQTLYSTVNVAGIIGPGCSTSTIAVSPLSGREQTALIVVHGAGSLLLEDRTLYPYSFGILDSTKAFAKAAHRLLIDNHWNRVGALYDPGRLYYSTTLQYFNGLIECSEFFECSTNFFFTVHNTSIPLVSLQESQLRIIFLFVGPDFLQKILCLAFHQNMRPPTYQWIIVSRVVSEITSISFNLKGIQYYCSGDDMKLMANNSLILHYSLKPLESQKVTDQGISYQEFLSRYQSMVSDYNINISSIFEENIEASFWATAYFDATWALALALNNSREELIERVGIDISEYKYGQPYATDIIKKNLLDLNFNGVSGRIAFRESTGYVPRLIDVYRISNENEMEIVAYYDSQKNSIIKIIYDFDFINGTFNQELIIVTINLGVGIIFMLLTILQLVLILIMHVCTLTFRNRKPVKASSPKLSHFAFIGCYILIVGAASYIIAETFSGQIDSNIKCNLIYVTYFMSSIGGTFIFATVCAHVWRLYRIYFFYLNPGKLISDSALITFIFILILCSLFLGALWVGFDRLIPMIVRREVITEQQDGGHNVFNLQVFLEIECLQSSSIEWLVSQLAFNLLVMGIALCLAILTRRIPHKDFKTRRIILLVYILSAVLVCGYVTSYILQISRAAVLARFIVLTTVHNCVIFFTALLLLLPPVFSALRDMKRAHHLQGSL